MPAPYQLVLRENANAFDYPTGDPTKPVEHVGPGGSTPPLDACAYIAAYNAALAANPGRGGIPGIDMDEVRAECGGGAIPAMPPPIPSPASASNPSETNPGPTGDSATQQGAPDPPVAATGSETPAPTSASVPTDEPRRPPQGEPLITHDADRSQRPATTGEPVDLFSGAFIIQETDFTIPNAAVPLAFTRSYRSGAPYFGPMGWNWDHCFNSYLRELASGDVAVWRNLREQVFRIDGAGFQPPRGDFEQLVHLPGPTPVYDVLEQGGRARHYERPASWLDPERIPLIWITDRHGNRLLFSYLADGKLAEVRDDDDRAIRFGYDACGLLVSVGDHTGRTFTYEHDEEAMHLVQVTTPGVRDFPDGIRKQYHYAPTWSPPDVRHNIVRVSDGQHRTYLENTYEEDPANPAYARVREQLVGGFQYQYQYTELQWVPADGQFVNVPAVRVEVMTPEFGLETFTFNYRGDMLDRRFRLNKDGSFRVVVWQYEVDEQGNLAAVTHPGGGQELYSFDHTDADPRMRGRLLQKELTAAAGFPSPSRIVWRGQYEPQHQLLVAEQNEQGALTRYRYDFDLTPAAPWNTGKLVELIQPAVTLPSGATQQSRTQYAHNNRGQLTEEVLPDGTRNQFAYEAVGPHRGALNKTTVDAGVLGVDRGIAYDVHGYPSTITDGNGNQSQQRFNALGLLETAIPSGGTSAAALEYQYDADGFLVAAERPAGSYTDSTFAGGRIRDELERDVLGYAVRHLQAVNTAAARIAQVQSDYRGRPTLTTYSGGGTLARTYDERGLLVREELKGRDGKRLLRRWTYDRAGNLSRTTDAHGSTTMYEYDGFSRLTRVTLPNGSVVRRRWQSGNVLDSEEVVGEDGTGAKRILAQKRFEHDIKGRTVREIMRSFAGSIATAVDRTTVFQLDTLDRIEAITNPRGGTWSRIYDGLGRVVEQTDPMGNVDRWEHDPNGNVLVAENHHREPDSSVSVIRREYDFDARNRRVRERTPDGTFELLEYDDRDLVVQTTNQIGHVVIKQYDPFGNQTAERIDPGGLNIERRWAYDDQDRLLTFTDPMGEVSTYRYDSVGRLEQMLYPNGLNVSRAYNDLDQVVRETMGTGAVFDYAYDGANRTVRVENVTVAPPLLPVATHLFGYDGFDRMTTAMAGSFAVRRTYDSLGRLVEEAGIGGTVALTYDEAAGSAHRRWPDGRTEVLAYDLNGIIASIEQAAPGTLGVGSTSIHYAPSGPNFTGETTFGAALSTAYRYDDRKRLVALTTTTPLGTVASVQYAYNAANWRQLESTSITAPTHSYFSFDSRHRLTESVNGFVFPFIPATTQAEHDAVLGAAAAAAATGGTHAEAFGYDAADARVTASATGTPVRNYTYVSGHRIASNGTRTFEYNADGVVESDGRFVYRADARGRIRMIHDAGATVTAIEYDPLGRPVRLDETGTPVRTLVYFGNDVYQENEAGLPARQFTRHPFTGSQVAVHLAGRTLYPVFDPRNNLRALVDHSGNVVEQYRYEIFGSPTILDPAGLPRSTSAFGLSPIFGGHAFLSRSQRYLSRRRLLDPDDGLFLSPDPKGYADSPSLYVYVAQNPVDYVDLYGESKSPPSLRADRDVSGSADDERWYDNPWWASITHNGLSAAVSFIDEASRRATLFESFLRPFQNMAVFGQRLPTQLVGRAGWSGLLRLEDVIRAPSTRLPSLFANQGQFARISMSRLNVVLAPLGVVSNAASLYDALLRSQKNGVERFADGTFSAAGLFSSGVGTTALLGAGFNAVGWTGAGSLLIRGAGFLGPAGLVTGSAAGGYAIGQFIDEKLGWHEALVDRAERNREIYGEMGLNDTAANWLGGVALLPLVSEAGEGIGWAAFKGYEGAGWVGGKAADAYDTVTDWVGYEFCNPFGGCD